MSRKVVPMIHVPDVKATVDWYERIGFKTEATYNNEGDGLSFAIVSFGSGQVMFSQDGQPSSQRRREVDLYVYTENVDALFEQLKDQVDVVATPDDTFYGMRELIIRDLNRFWITFGQESDFALLMRGVRENKHELVQTVLARSHIKPETLSTALSAALASEDTKSEIVDLLEHAGAIRPPQLSQEILKSYVGKYEGKPGPLAEITLQDGQLFARMGSQPPVDLWPADLFTFRPLAFDGVSIRFTVESGLTTGLTFRHGSEEMYLEKIES